MKYNTNHEHDRDVNGWKILDRSGRTVTLSNCFNSAGSIALPVVYSVLPLHSEKHINYFITGGTSLSEHYFELFRDNSFLLDNSCIYPVLNNASGLFVPRPRLSALTRPAVSRTRDPQKIHGIAAVFVRLLQTLQSKALGEQQCRKDCTVYILQ